MPVSPNDRISGPYTADGSTNPALVFDFKIFATTDVVVVQTDTAGANTTLALTTDFTVSMNGDQDVSPGGSVSLVSTPALNFHHTITSAVPAAQSILFSNNASFSPSLTTKGFDKLTVLVQEQARDSALSLRFPVSDGTGLTTLLPSAAARAGKLLFFGEDGGVIVSPQSVGAFRADWDTGISYNIGDVVRDGANGANTMNIYITGTNHVSGVWATDLAAGKWKLAVDISAVQDIADAASASAAAAAASEAETDIDEAAAAVSVSDAATSASAAASSASTATTQASNASTSASAAASSASTASTQASNAATSASGAASSATAASSSATSASSSASTATTQAGNASTSATNAANSASAALTSKNNAATSETNAASSASAAATSEANAATSASNAASSASAAATSESNAATSASHALTSENNAAASAAAAAASSANGIYNSIVDVNFSNSPLTPAVTDDGTLFRIDTSGGAFVVNLSALSTYGGDVNFAFVKVTGDGNSFTVNANVADTIEGSASFTSSTQWEINLTIGSNADNSWIHDIHAASIADGSVTFAKIQNITTDTLIGRDAAGSGVVTGITLGTGIEFTGSNTIQRSALTGDATASAGSNAVTVAKINGVALGSTTATSANILIADGTQWVTHAVSSDATISNTGALTIAADAVSNTKLANMANATFKGRTTAGTGDPEDMTATQSTALLNAMVGDTGSGGTKGLAPAPASGDAAAGKFLKADGTWTAPAGGGSGTTLKGQTILTSGSGTYTTPSGSTYLDVTIVGGGGSGGGSGGGNNGSTTTFGSSLLTAPGGVGGGASSDDSNTAAGTLATASGGIGVVIRGGSGGAGYVISDSSAAGQALGGAGGNSIFGGGGAGGGQVGGGQNGLPGTAPGAGGGGLTNNTSFLASAGGSAGSAVIGAIITSPSGTYAYAVGAGGGSSGSSGAGAAGIIIVRAYG